MESMLLTSVVTDITTQIPTVITTMITVLTTLLGNIYFQFLFACGLTKFSFSLIKKAKKTAR